MPLTSALCGQRRACLKAELEEFATGWHGLYLGLNASEIDALICALKNLKREETHFHYRSAFEGVGGIADVTFYFRQEEQEPNMELEDSAKPAHLPRAT